MRTNSNKVLLSSDDEEESEGEISFLRQDKENAYSKEHNIGHENRRSRVIFDDDDESLQNDDEKATLTTPNRKIANASAVIDELEAGLQELNLSISSPFAKSPTCSLRNIPANSIPGESGAWALSKKDDYYYLSDKNFCSKNAYSQEWPSYQISTDLYERLYDHQKVGVQWLVAQHAKGTGCVLGDDMGLGKTFMTLTLLGGLMKAKTIKNALVLCPVSLLRTWENEAHKVLNTYLELPSVTIKVISSEMEKRKRAHLLQKAMGCSKKRPHLIISTYGLLTSNPADLTPPDHEENYYWSYVVLDEGQKIKNASTQVNKGCHQISRSSKTSRLLLTGTPIMNNLVELWTLFDWATNRKLLGKKVDFLKNYAEPIERGRHKDAHETTLKIAEKANELLQQKLKTCFLQRLKKDVFSEKLPMKRDLVVWTHLSQTQRAMYEKFVTAGNEVHMLLNGEKTSPLEAITYLKKLCGHPTLITKDACDIGEDWQNPNTEDLLQQSKKLQALVVLIEALTKAGHRVLIFSQSTRMLDIIQRVLRKVTRMSRIDGATKERDRQMLVDDFNSTKSKCCCMLLSTKAGGLGLTLTGADRAVIYDPSWNPAEDSQAVDRCYRIGTTKPVTIYRLIAAGTVEERMYEKQVFKDGIRRTLLESAGAATDRYFSRNDLKRFFTLSPVGQCEMLERIRMLSNGRPPTSPTASGGTLRLLEKHPTILGISSHDSLYNGAAIDCDANEEHPFSGNLGAPQVLSDKEETYIPLGKQQGVLNKSRRDREKAKSDKKDNDSLARSTPLFPIEIDEKDDISKDHDGIIDLVTYSDVLPEETLNELEIEMKELLDALENERSLEKTEKLLLHKKIANLGKDLGWI